MSQPEEEERREKAKCRLPESARRWAKHVRQLSSEMRRAAAAAISAQSRHRYRAGFKSVHRRDASRGCDLEIGANWRR